MEWQEVEKRAAGIFASDIDTEITPTSPITNTATVEIPLVRKAYRRENGKVHSFS